MGVVTDQTAGQKIFGGAGMIDWDGATEQADRNLQKLFSNGPDQPHKDYFGSIIDGEPYYIVEGDEVLEDNLARYLWEVYGGQADTSEQAIEALEMLDVMEQGAHYD